MPLPTETPDTNPETPAPMTDERLANYLEMTRLRITLQDYVPIWCEDAASLFAELIRHRSSPSTAAGGTIADFVSAQREWSERTFGPGPRAKGNVDHIRKELTEIEANPSDVVEWCDVAALALDGAWREGHSPEEIAAALFAKLEKNKRRQWPDWRTHDPDKGIQHIKSEPPK